MKVKLHKNARIWHKAGEIIDVSPEECHFLTSTDGAVVVDAVKTSAAKVETPEDKLPKAEVPEKKATDKKPVTKKK